MNKISALQSMTYSELVSLFMGPVCLLLSSSVCEEDTFPVSSPLSYSGARLSFFFFFFRRISESSLAGARPVQRFVPPPPHEVIWKGGSQRRIKEPV